MNPNWQNIHDGGLKAIYDEGDFDGAIVTEASVIHGGNGLWTATVHQMAKGRKKKRGSGRIHGKCVTMYFPDQQSTRGDAVLLCEVKWSQLFATAPPASPATSPPPAAPPAGAPPGSPDISTAAPR